MPVTFEPLLRFYFFKMLDRSELNFLLIDHLSTCLPVTTRQKSPRGDFAKNGLHWHYLIVWMYKIDKSKIVKEILVGGLVDDPLVFLFWTMFTISEVR